MKKKLQIIDFTGLERDEITEIKEYLKSKGVNVLYYEKGRTLKETDWYITRVLENIDNNYDEENEFINENNISREYLVEKMKGYMDDYIYNNYDQNFYDCEEELKDVLVEILNDYK